MIHRWQRRLVERVVGRLGGEVEWPLEHYGEVAEPDYYIDGCAVYDMNRRILALAPEDGAFRSLMEKFDA